ncbi:MAG: ABC transporter permease [Limnochordia bacterium]|jgi:ABC-type transport system involved in multi-copper enzyme maturation permease subunit
MNQMYRQIFRFELRTQLRSLGFWASLLVVAALLLFNGVDSWELAPTHLLIKLVGGTTSFVFLLSAFVTLNGLSREERAGFSDVFFSLPPTNAAIYGGKLAAVAVSLSGFILLMLLGTLIIGPIRGEFGLQYWAVSGLLVLETALAVAAGISVAALLTAIIAQHRSRYVLALLWLVTVTLLAGLAYAYNRYEWLSFSPINIGEDPYFFNLVLGFFPGSGAMIRHALVQVCLAVLLFLVARCRFLRWREVVDPRLRRLATLALVLFVTSFAWQYVAWQQHHAEVAAQVNYYADARFSKTGSKAMADWQSLGAIGELQPGIGIARNFHVARYDINLQLDNPQGGLQADVVMLIEQPTKSSLFFTLHRTLVVGEVAWQPAAGSHSQHNGQASGTTVADQNTAGAWRPVNWQRAGDYLRVDLPADSAVSQQSSMLLRITYAGPTEGVWLGAWGKHHVQFVTKRGAYLQAQLGWYPLPGGWQLGASTGAMVNGFYREGILPPHPLVLLSAENGYKRSEFHLHVQPRFGHQVVSNLPSIGVNTMAGWVDGVSLFAAPLEMQQAHGLTIFAAPQVIHSVSALFDLYVEIKAFYQEELGLRIPGVTIVTVPDWLDRAFASYQGVGNNEYIKVSSLLGEVTAWRENELAVAIRDAKRARVDENRKYFAVKPLDMAIQRAFWNGSTGHASFRQHSVTAGYLQSAVVAGASRYMSLLLAEHTGEAGAAQYQAVIKGYLEYMWSFFAQVESAETARPKYLMELLATASAPQEPIRIDQRSTEIAQVVLFLHWLREQEGAARVGKLLAQLQAVTQQGPVTWQAWEGLIDAQ